MANPLNFQADAAITKDAMPPMTEEQEKEYRKNKDKDKKKDDFEGKTAAEALQDDLGKSAKELNEEKIERLRKIEAKNEKRPPAQSDEVDEEGEPVIEPEEADEKKSNSKS